MEFLLATLGGLLFFWRLSPSQKSSVNRTTAFDKPFLVSVVIPARNEEKNIPHLLASLKNQQSVTPEIIVVDDGSTDETAKIAQDSGVVVVKSPPRPDDWVGKSWACWQGFKYAKGDYILFTDADTTLAPDALCRSISKLKDRHWDMLSATPYHSCNKWWEKWLGGFHCLIMAVANPFAKKPNPKRPYGIGQFMLFSRDAYLESGGHKSIRSEWVDDISLVKVALARGISYGVYDGDPLYEVKMYDNWGEFMRGWQRQFRGGVEQLSALKLLEMFLLVNFLLASLTFSNGFLQVFFFLWSSVMVAHFQKGFGRVHLGGALLPVISVAVLTLVGLGTLKQVISRQPIIWKDRKYRV